MRTRLSAIGHTVPPVTNSNCSLGDVSEWTTRGAHLEKGKGVILL